MSTRYRDGIFRLPGGYLRAEIAPNDDARRSNPHAAFSGGVDSGARARDERVCLAPVYPASFIPVDLRPRYRVCSVEVG